MVCSFHCFSDGKTCEGAFGTSGNRELFTCTGGGIRERRAGEEIGNSCDFGGIFVHVPETSLPSVLSILGVIALLRKERGPIVISDKQLDSLRMLCEHAETLEVVNEGLPGESVIGLLLPKK